MTNKQDLELFNHKRLPDYIAHIEDRSDELTIKVRIIFKNGYELSIIKGPYTYGGPKGLLEIAPFGSDGKRAPHLFDEDDKGDTVLGHCSKEKVLYYINKIGNHRRIEDDKRKNRMDRYRKTIT